MLQQQKSGIWHAVHLMHPDELLMQCKRLCARRPDTNAVSQAEMAHNRSQAFIQWLHTHYIILARSSRGDPHHPLLMQLVKKVGKEKLPPTAAWSGKSIAEDATHGVVRSLEYRARGNPNEEVTLLLLLNSVVLSH